MKYSSDSKILSTIVSTLNDPMIQAHLHLNRDGLVAQINPNLITTTAFAKDIQTIVKDFVLNKKRWTEIDPNANGSCFMYEWT